MRELLIAAAITLCFCFGLRQRYAPFASVIIPGRKRIVYICYVVLTACNLAVLTAVLHIWGVMASFDYLRYGGIVYGVALMLVNVFVIPGKLREHLFVFGVVLNCSYLLMTVPNYVISLLIIDDIYEHIFVVLAVYFAALLVTHWPLEKLLRGTVEPFLYLETEQYWNTIWFIPLALFGTKFLFLGGEHNSGSILQFLSSMLHIFIIIMICVGISNDYKRICERQIMGKQLESQKLHYSELKVRVEEARKAKHDFKHHITAIRHYIDIDDKEGLRSYCDELSEAHTGREDRIPYTGNAAADGVLYHYMQRAKQEQIDFRYFGTIHSNGIADVDLCVLLGNALDNALTGCLTIPHGRSVAVVSQSEDRLLSIVVRNTFDGIVEQSEAGLLSRKRKNRPGVGIASMRSICERYGGHLETKWDEQHFTVMLILSLAENP